MLSNKLVIAGIMFQTPDQYSKYLGLVREYLGEYLEA
jgi:hypothetical protein